jgi:hypothetical protein
MTDECAVLPAQGGTLLGTVGLMRQRHQRAMSGLTAVPAVRHGCVARP